MECLALYFSITLKAITLIRFFRDGHTFTVFN